VNLQNLDENHKHLSELTPRPTIIRPLILNHSNSWWVQPSTGQDRNPPYTLIPAPC
jgi:hypothetical protein